MIQVLLFMLGAGFIGFGLGRGFEVDFKNLNKEYSGQVEFAVGIGLIVVILLMRYALS